MPRIYRQAATNANTLALRKDEQGNIIRRPTLELSTSLKPAEVGQTIPIIFCKRVSGVGGAWVVPPLVRTGLQTAATGDAVFSHAFLLSDGQITSPVADFDTDILIGYYPWGGYPGFGTFIKNRFEEVTYGSLPTTNNIYTLSFTQYFDFETKSYTTGPIAVGGNTYTHNLPTVLSEIGTGTITVTSSSPFCTQFSWSRNFATEVRVYYDQTSVASGTVIRTYSSVNTLGINWDYVFSDDTGVLSSGNFSSATEFRTASNQLTPISVTISNPEFTPLDIDDNALFTYSNFSVLDQFIFTINETIRKPFIIPDPLDLALLYRENTTGDFSGMTLLGLKGNHEMIDKNDPINVGFTDDLIDQVNNTHNNQASVFCSNGINVYNLITATTGPSNNYADLVNHLGLQYAETISMDTTSLTAAANFTNTNSLFFNGALVDAVNYKEWIESTAGFFLLVPLNLESRIGLRPALPVTGANAINTGVLTPAYTFDEDTIVEGTYAIDYIPLSERKPFEAVMLWRDQADGGLGIFQPFTTSLKVRYAADTGVLPQEQYDMSDFCVTSAHATLVAKYFLAKRKRTTHTVSFSTDIYTTLGLKPGDLIAIELDRVTSDGTSRTETNHYLIDTLTRRMDGTASITAEHFPLSSGASVIATDIVSGSFTVV